MATPTKSTRRVKRLRLILFLFSSVFLPWVLCYAEEESDDEVETEEEAEISIIYKQESLSAYFDDQPKKEDDRERSLELELEWESSLSDSVNGFLSASGIVEQIQTPGKSKWKQSDFVELNELWLQWEPAEDSTYFRLGRQSIEDKRGWWWDSELDAITLGKDFNETSMSIVLGRLSTPISSMRDIEDPEEDSLYWLLSQMSFAETDYGKFDAFFSHLDDRSSEYRSGQTVGENQFDEADARINWLGLRYFGDFPVTGYGGGLSLSADFAIMRGKEELTLTEEEEEDDENEEENENASRANHNPAEPLKIAGTERQSIRGWAIDTALSWRFPHLNGTELTLGYAAGSGTPKNDPEGSKSFRQTGLHGNDKPLNYYGALFEPSLSNIEITSLTLGIPVKRNGLVSLLLHKYKKMYTFDESANNKLDLETLQGIDSLGEEIGISYQHEFENDFTIDATFSRFTAGDAYGQFSGKEFYWLEVEVSYEF